MKIKPKLDRRDLVNHNIEIILRLTQIDRIRDNLIKSGEFIITAEDILEAIDTIPGPLVDRDSPVKAKDCQIVYKF